jgi:hypothetical protein
VRADKAHNPAFVVSKSGSETQAEVTLTSFEIDACPVSLDIPEQLSNTLRPL